MIATTFSTRSSAPDANNMLQCHSPQEACRETCLATAAELYQHIPCLRCSSCGVRAVLDCQHRWIWLRASFAFCADLQVYICGDYVVSAVEFNALQETRAGCRNSCSLSSVGLSVASQYYWSVSRWGLCLAACGKSTQERTALCMNSIDGR